MNLYDVETPARILFVIQKLMNVKPGPNDDHWLDIVRFQDLQDRALKFVQLKNIRQRRK
jgi:hypothetical protein